ncbi:hypothetical protein PFMALIP_06067 [Plasmodium falciparum MaliPS096_E11]|uniref:Plasmodium falciparum erythrocyte membrane protein 1 acidic terminal segment domain-containing protein n=1 Tax=Plasmodium falciparum MaliPS096_E11 TaxID=1036727 RepID=A0A024WG39_PLAFA|nr:hypothetical protein PFMALIP_06067 [Plasmodium falciparum MaliPS096_E11]
MHRIFLTTGFMVVPLFFEHLVLGKSNTCDKTPRMWYDHHMCGITTKPCLSNTSFTDTIFKVHHRCTIFEHLV